VPERKPTILIVMGGFWPGHEANGPNTSLIALCRALGSAFSFRIIARDRADEPGAAALAPAGVWHKTDYAEILYCETPGRTPRRLFEALRATPHDMLVLNGFFDREFTIPLLLWRRLGRLPRKPLILSPRGEFSPGALGLKAPRKRAYVAFAEAAGLLRDVHFHATGGREREEILALLPKAIVSVAANIRKLDAPAPMPKPGELLRIAFLSRITPKKNLDYALRVLAQVRSPVAFDIYGPVNDQAHWAACQALIAKLPPHINASYRGVISNVAVHGTLSGYDLFFLPTRGENFGHAIVDALAASCPVLISDQTPWVTLDAQKAGWALPLADQPAFARAIDAFAAMAEPERAIWRSSARGYAETIVHTSDAIAATRAMFLAAL
jgi:glycosyltransferase involved in cell wall biosynthesis